jgi:hypothetical protein
MNERWRTWKLLVGLLGGRNDVAYAAMLRREASADAELWRQLISMANEHLVTALLWSALQRSGLAAEAPTNAADYLRSFHDYNSARNHAIEAQVAECAATFNAAGIEPMLLKGAAHLAAGLYGAAGDRYLSDVDLLVRSEHVDRAQELMRELGYRPATDKNYSRHHHLAPMIRDAAPVAIELHRAPLPRHVPQALSLAVLWDASTASTANGARVRLPSPTDAAMLTFLHSAVADRDLALLLMPLRLFYDVHLLALRHGASIDWPTNFDRARRVGAATSLQRYLHVLSRIFGGGSLGEVRRSAADRVYFSLCAGAVRWPVIGRWAQRVERFSERARIRERTVSS